MFKFVLVTSTSICLINMRIKEITHNSINFALVKTGAVTSYINVTASSFMNKLINISWVFSTKHKNISIAFI